MRAYLRGVLRVLHDAGWKIEICESPSSEEASQLARRAAENKLDAVFAMGGDGTMGRVAHGLVGSGTALAALPTGTSNVWATELGQRGFHWPFSTGALTENAKLLARSPSAMVDVGVCNGRHFLLWGGIGLDAITIHQLEPLPRLQKYGSVAQYFVSSVWNAMMWSGMDMRITADGQKADGHYLLAVATNIRRYVGGLAVLSPKAYLDDGEMDMWLISGHTVRDALRAFFDMRAGRHLKSSQARRIPFRSARVECDSAFSIQTDGDPGGDGLSADYSIRKQALRVILPAAAGVLLKEQTLQ